MPGPAEYQLRRGTGEGRDGNSISRCTRDIAVAARGIDFAERSIGQAGAYHS
jgi:hypothetical protein